jgi:thioredoxin reductase
VDIVQLDHHFDVHFQDGASVLTKKVLFATGVKDILPPIEGLDALLGKSVFHCPYCHGWEARDQAIAILGNGESAIHFATLLHSLSSDIIICTNGASEIRNEDRIQLERLGIPIIETPILRLNQHDSKLEGLVFADGTERQREAIFLRTAQEQHSTLPAKLGCTITEHGFVVVDEQGKTSVEGVYAAGDLTSGKQQVLYAASQGAFAASMINTELAHEAFANIAQVS